MEMLAGGVMLLLGALLNGEWGRFDPASVTLKSGLAFLYLAAIGSVVTFTAYAWLLRVSTPAKIATAGYVNPMVAVFLGWAFMGESLSRRTLLASAIIVVGVVVIVTGSDFARGVRDRMSGARTRGGSMINPRIAASPRD
jgi:drug/metabolite transporter (DMT)-like permease